MLAQVGSVEGVAILGVSAGYHDAAAAVSVDGVVVAAAQEERFTRVKHDPSMPANAIAWCLDAASVADDGLEAVVFYDKPLTSYERVLSTHARVGPRGFPQLARAVRSWTRSKLWIAPALERIVVGSGRAMPRVIYCEHHRSHAAAAFYPSPFERAAVLTVDGVGEWATTSIGEGSGSSLELRSQIDFPDSVGLLYSTLTAHCGFAVNDGEYKLMGLAPYGAPTFLAALEDRVVHVAEDGSIELDQRYFDYRAGRRMASRRLDGLLGGPPRRPDEPLTQRHADVARSAQALVEEIVLAMARHLHRLTGLDALCLGGGVALNCVANAALLRDGPFEEIWVQPAAGDAGSAIGAALWAEHEVFGRPRTPSPDDGMAGCALGPAFDDDEIGAWLDAAAIDHQHVASEAERYELVAAALDAGAVVGWFQGRMEFGPRALGHRSILADPRDASMVSRINLAVKGREGFRPFAPAVLADRAADWFDVDRELPYMLVTVPVRSAHVDRADAGAEGGRSFAERLGAVDSPLPACTHVDGSARVQTVDAGRAPELHGLLCAFERRTGCPVLLNTSFNRADEPIVRSPADAYRCFVAAGLDLLVLGPFLVRRGAGAGREDEAGRAALAGPMRR